MLAVDHLSTMSSFACVIAPTLSNDAPSVQPVLKTLLRKSSRTKTCLLSNHSTLALTPSFTSSVQLVLEHILTKTF
jgi:hypothetical protein